VRWLAAGLFVVVFAPAAAAQRGAAAPVTRLVGVVTDTAHRPLLGVQVSVVGAAVAATTDSAGRFELTALPAGPLRVAFRRLGFAPDTVRLDARASAGDSASASLRPLAVRLAPTVTTAERGFESAKLAGFYRRRRSGRGQYVTRREFDRFAPPDVASVLRRFHSLQLEPAPGGTLVMSARGLAVRNMRLAACAMRIGLDGQLMPGDFRIDEIPIDDVEAIEVYAGPATMPPQFETLLPGQDPISRDTALHGGGSSGIETSTSCGLVMIWTVSGGG
jgi:hypothetical protein